MSEKKRLPQSVVKQVSQFSKKSNSTLDKEQANAGWQNSNSNNFQLSLFQFQLRNHQLRKTAEKNHQNVIKEFYIKKRKIVNLIKEKEKAIQTFCQKNKQVKRLIQHKSLYNRTIPGQWFFNSLTDREFGCRWNNSRIQKDVDRTQIKMNKRQVYLSNISNINELKKSLSFSRAKFNRKPIKMQRQIGKKYTPFQDKLIGDENCVKGIFL